MPETQLIPDLVPALPEIVIAIGAMALLMLGVFRGNRATGMVTGLGMIIMLIAAFLVLVQPDGREVTFAGAFVIDEFARYTKILILLGAGAVLFMSTGYLRAEHLERFEYPVLILLATLGMLMMVSANDFMALYLGLELQSLSLYIIASFNRDSVRSTEAGLKYFVLGALSSGMLLYGISLVYGFSGTTNFDVLAAVLSEEGRSIGLLFGLVFFLAGLAFKISAVPFHMWTPDVYEGSPTAVTAFFAAAPKVAAMGLFVRAMYGAFPAIAADWQQIVVFVSIASMAVGAFAAIGQTNIKRLMAYSSIGHMGYALVGLASGTEQGVTGVLLYMTIYMITSLGTFACILAMRRPEGLAENIDDLAGLARNQPGLALCLGLLMFSLAGIPPLAGFFGKFFVFLAAVEAGLYTLAIIGVLTSVVGAYYYLRIVKIMYFDDPAEPFVTPLRRDLGLIAATATLFSVPLFLIFIAPIQRTAEIAAQSLI